MGVPPIGGEEEPGLLILQKRRRPTSTFMHVRKRAHGSRWGGRQQAQHGSGCSCGCIF